MKKFSKLTLPSTLLCIPMSFAWLLVPVLYSAPTSSPTASPTGKISGVAMNRTTGRPAAGDDVVLIQLGQGMQETTRAKTDAQGRFTLTGVDDGMHLVRVTHDKVPYFTPVPPGTTAPVPVDVYDSAAKVPGISGEADVLRIQATSDALEVTELWAISNNSAPPRTQFSARSFEIYIPPAAKIANGAAMGPGGAPIQASPVPLDTPGHYAFVFPLRPGETRFQISYKLPYSGSFTFKPQVSLPTTNFAVMIPKSMKFDASASAPFQPVKDEVDAQVFLAKNAIPSQSLAFTIGGTGEMPADNAGQNGANGDTATNGQNPAAAPPGSNLNSGRPGGGLGNPINTPDPLNKYKWWILAAIALLFVAGIGFAMRKPKKSPDLIDDDGAAENLSFFKPVARIEPSPEPTPASAVEPVVEAPVLAESHNPIPATSPERIMAPIEESALSAVPAPVEVPALTPAFIPARPAPTPEPLPASKASVLNVLKEELFRLETDRLEGRLGHDDYWQIKNSLDVVLRYALRREDPPPPNSTA
jgi:hypothetical protein